MKKFELSEQNRNMITNYLASRPYNEVYQLIALILQLPEITEEAKNEPNQG